MKIRNNVMVTAALCFAAFVLGACSYWDGSSSDGQGSIIINFENSGARYTVGDSDQPEMKYTITLTSPGQNTIPVSIENQTSAFIPAVAAGNWHINVQAVGDRVRGEGDNDVEVTAGKTASARIKMKVTGTRVSSWDQLVTDFNDTSLQNHSIEIVRSFNTSPTSGFRLETKKTITLWAENNVTIKRDDAMLNDPVFLTLNCTLILDGTQGTINIEGNNNPACSRSLINVENGSTLRILKGVTIANNVTTYINSNIGGGFGGGVYVNETGKFFMEGGTISKNTASNNGGGVYIKNGGKFTKTGGIIHGYSEKGEDNSNSNMVISNNQITSTNGHAVYSVSDNDYSDSTLDEDDAWPPAP